MQVASIYFHVFELPLQEIMKPTATATKGHGDGILTALDETWRDRCVLSRHEAAKKLDFSHSFRATECCQLAFCKHEGLGKQAFHMHNNLIKFLKPSIRAITQPRKKAVDKIDPSNAQKRKPVYPVARQLLDKGFAVIKIESVIPKDSATHTAPEFAAVCDVGQDDEGNAEWERFVQQRLALKGELQQEEQPCKKHWLHVGFMNHSSSTFSVLPLDCEAEGTRFDRVFVENVVALRSFEFFRDYIDFDVQWKCTLCRILCSNDVLTESEMVPGHPLTVAQMPATESAIFWRGRDAEEKFRAAEAARAAKAKKRGPSKRGKDSRPTRQLKLTDVVNPPAKKEPAAIEDKMHGIDSDSSDSDSDSNSDSENRDSDSDTKDETEATAANDENQRGAGAEFERQLDEFLQNEEVADLAQKPNQDSDEEHEVPDFKKHEVDDILRATSSASDHPALDANVADPAAASSSATAPAPPPPLPKRAARRAHGVRDTSGANITRIEIPGHGELVYYHDLEAIQAKCTEPGHGDCRKQRTIKPGSKAGQGRPIGLLVSWLMQGSQFPSQAEHSHSCKPSLDQRVEARNVFMGLDEAESFLAFERAKGSNEDDEPVRIS